MIIILCDALGVGDAALNKKDKNRCFHGACLLRQEEENFFSDLCRR